MYSFQSRVRYSETDSESKLTMMSILDYFQDASTFHSEKLELGISYLADKRLAWVLNFWQIVVIRYPAFCEEITIGTFPYAFKGFLGYRNFYMEDAKGERIAYANSMWTLIDTNSMRPKKPTQDMIDGYVISKKLEMEYAPRKIELPALMKEQEPIVIRKHHLDTNHHVNNGEYVKMAIDVMPENFRVKELRAEYKKSAVLGNILIPEIYKTGTECVIAFKDEGGQVYAVVNLRA